MPPRSSRGDALDIVELAGPQGRPIRALSALAGTDLPPVSPRALTSCFCTASASVCGPNCGVIREVESLLESAPSGERGPSARGA